MLTPLNDRVLVRRVDTERETAGGIVIPAQAQRRNQEAVVLAVGPGKVIGPAEVLAELAKEAAPFHVLCGQAYGDGDWHAEVMAPTEFGTTDSEARENLAGRLAATVLSLVSERRRPVDLKPGDRVLIPKHGEMVFEMSEDGTDQASTKRAGGMCVMLVEKDIIAVMGE